MEKPRLLCIVGEAYIEDTIKYIQKEYNMKQLNSYTNRPNIYRDETTSIFIPDFKNVENRIDLGRYAGYDYFLFVR